jgi:cysteine desulfurase/selenocysteine lyase
MNKWREINCKSGVSTGRGSSALNKRAEQILHESEQCFRNFFGLSEEYKYIYSKNVTEAINILALSLEQQINSLDMIVVGPFEHHSNYLPWKSLAKKTGALFCEIPLDKQGNIDYSYLIRNKDRIKIISVSAVSNSFGYRLDIDKICDIIESKTLFFVDQSQVSAHMKICTNDRIDGHFISSHKMYGPKNIAFAAVKQEIIHKLNPVILGGGMVDYVGFQDIWLDGRDKFLAGTMDIALIGAWAEACRFISDVSYDIIQSRNEHYSKIIIKALEDFGYERVVINDNCVDYIISFTHDGMHPHDISEYLANLNIIIRSGNLCSQNSIRKINNNAINRISLGLGITDDDLNKLCAELGKINDIKNQYPKKINELIKNKPSTLLIPDLIMVKEGVACGDQIIISGELDNERLLFNFSAINACDLCKAVCAYLQEIYNDKNIDSIAKSSRLLFDKITQNHSFIFQLFNLDENTYAQRYNCLVSPIKMMISFLGEIKATSFTYGDKPDTHKTMECDACVGACRINWNNQAKEKIDHHGNRTFTTEYLKKWLPLGKIVLNDNDVENLKLACKNMTAQDHQFLSDYTINSFVFHHVIKYCPDLLDDHWKAAAYLIQKNEITRQYFEQVKQYIIDTGLDIYFVKGCVSQKYYQNPNLRIHSDYDLISTNSNDAFKLADYLIRNGFSIRPNLFSLKKMNHDGKEIMSGHFHVQKIIDDAYMFELDISFPGFPINRVDLFYPTIKNNEISTEDQIVVSILHLFKHSNVYMKDINDIYYMLQEDINIDYLENQLNKYNLTKFFNLTVMYIYNNYAANLDKIGGIIKKFNIEKNILDKYPDWPYDAQTHLKIKLEDFNDRNSGKQEFDRKYLFPLVIFNGKFDFSKIKKAKSNGFNALKILDNIYNITHGNYSYYITTVGVFIDNYIDTSAISRRECLKILNELLVLLKIDDFHPIPYATEHFYVRVI